VNSIFNPNQLGTNFGMMWRRTSQDTGYRPITAFLPEGEGHLHGDIVVKFRSGAILAQNRIIIKVAFLN